MQFKAKVRRLAGAGTAVAFAAAVLTAAGSVTEAAAEEAVLYQIKNGNTGLCLTANNLQENWNRVFTNTCVPGAATQKWRVVGGHFTPQGSATPARCLDILSGSIFTWPCDGTTGQDWRTNGESTTWIRSYKYSNSCLHSSGDADETVRPQTCGSTASRWVIAPA